MLHSAPRGSLCAEAFTAIESIEADLEAFSPGRAAAVGVRGGLAEGERAFKTIMYHIRVQRALKSNAGGSVHTGIGNYFQNRKRWRTL